LIEDYKNQITNLIDSNPDKYKEHKKNIKYIQINCFCRNINYSICKEIMFEDFGITIKITNLHFRDIFKDLIMESKIFISNSNHKDRRFDWFWKATDYKSIINMNINNYQEQIFNNTNYQNSDNFDNSNNSNNSNNFDNSNNSDNFDNSNNYDNYDNSDNYQNRNDNESFKIIQKIPELIGQNKIITKCLDLDLDSKSNLNIIKPSEEQMSKIISNSIIIEDDSFSIIIDNTTIMSNF